MKEDERITRALGYPYARPAGSYLFTAGDARDLPDDISLEGRVPVLACGSNAAPEQLRRKYGISSKVKIPVTAAILDDIACTYSAHFTAYGSVAATLCDAPGIRSHAHITWLTNSELEQMHATEAVGSNYRFIEFAGPSLVCSIAGALHRFHAYLSLRGSLLLDGSPIIVSGISCQNACFPLLDQAGIQTRLRDILAPNMDIYGFIRQNIEDDAIRSKRTKTMAGDVQLYTNSSIKTLLPKDHDDN
jgi:hypothetical protein